MPDQADPNLPDGLYEQLITRALKTELDGLTSSGQTVARTDPIDPAEAHARIARHVGTLVGRALRGLPSKERETRQAEIADRKSTRLNSSH